MKRILLVATMASVALASCVKDESVDLTQQAKKLSFEAPVMGTQSRAVYGEIYGTTYPTDENFVVYAVKHNDDLTTWDAAAGFWTDNKATPITVAKENNSGWEEENGTDYYWPKATDEDVKLSFAAYSPAGLPIGATASYGATGLTITNFTVADDVEEQIDLMFSDRTLNQTEADNASGVSINFNHALSSIVFSAVENDANAGYQITGITIQGDFVTKATFNEAVTDGPTYVYSVGGTGNTAVPAWSNPTTTNDQQYTPTFTAYTVTGDATEFTGGNVDNQTGGNVANKAETAILTIPQEIPAEATVTITYVYTPDNGVGGTYNKTVNFSEFITTGTPITAWEVGKRYTYLFQFGGTQKIFFKPTVKDWTSVAAGTVEI